MRNDAARRMANSIMTTARTTDSATVKARKAAATQRKKRGMVKGAGLFMTTSLDLKVSGARPKTCEEFPRASLQRLEPPGPRAKQREWAASVSMIQVVHDPRRHQG